MKPRPPKPRLLLFVVADRAEQTLTTVLQRIPRQVLSEYVTEILVVDDASDDRTFEIGHEYRSAHSELSITVVRNDFTQGYGGNQKVGFAYAIGNGFDLVAMLHGDGLYAPEELPRLLDALRGEGADAVFGSRMMKPPRAATGAMPLYKRLGNRILSRAQNLLLGARLSEFHSGYRVYSVRRLEKLPFRLNSNEFHFDTEIIIQLLHAGAKIVEVPIPPYHGDAIDAVTGVQYAAQVMKATLQSVLHRSGLMYQRRFDTEPQDNTVYDLKLGYPSSHTMVLDRVPRGSRVMDIGSGPGEFARELIRRGATVTVVDRDIAAAKASGVETIQQDLDEPIRFSIEPHSHILLLDVIEHLKDPEKFIEEIRQQFTFDTKTVLITTPNVAFVIQRLMLLLGQFNYGKRGILDRTHARLFTFRSMERLLRDAGFRVKEVKGIPAPFPKVLGTGVLGRGAVRLNLWLISVSKTLFAYQILVLAETTPDVRFVLSDAMRPPESKRVPSVRSG
jgi:glycosyltransferase involved in cell wall biosynthesis